MIVIPNSHAEAGERGTLRCTYFVRDVCEIITSDGIEPCSRIGNSCQRKVPLPTSSGGRLRDDNHENYCFLRGTGAGGNGLRIGTIAALEGSLAALARDITSS